MSKELRNELIALGLASYAFRDTDGMRSTAIRTNDEAADLVLAFVARRLAEAKSSPEQRAEWCPYAEDATEAKTWWCEGCEFASAGATEYQHVKDATKHWMDYGWPHVVRPTKTEE